MSIYEDRDGLLGEVKRQKVYIEDLRDAIGVLEGVIDRRNITLAKVRAVVADPHAALVVDRIRAALEPTDLPKGKP